MRSIIGPGCPARPYRFFFQTLHWFYCTGGEGIIPLLVRQINSNDRVGEPIKDLYTMNYSSFGMLAIKALQEQHAVMLLLQNELDKLLTELKKL